MFCCSGRGAIKNADLDDLSEYSMGWFSKIFKDDSTRASSPEDVVSFYQQLGFFVGADATAAVQRYIEEHGAPPDPSKPWDDVFLLAHSQGDVWADDPEADVCAENEVYSEVLPQWAAISHGAFLPGGITEYWANEFGPITLTFELEGQQASVSPGYLDDWIDLDVLRQINSLIVPKGRQFECAVDGNFALVLCLTSEQKTAMRVHRRFPFAW
jgi:hypothetical protein